ncbi:DUF86 domain-containing protein [Chelativorans sp. M5D2P16]|uniref:HepT-like ribonuclease domain-containing protein n=1 Tax=Chelativorans sp. M5D2P16 TaxID=3095678 RepID=UPI002ACA23A6|nr:HepT-like ribonuclease domain-containing protein [Chelativorans sp. M5D2P16]MDZ5696781.1 HepT-like ribonuclease domain-containing protein [Chelativorans sp. M5D2P16]
MSMQNGSVQELLQDILDFADRVERFSGSATKKDFLNDEMMRWAVAKCIEAIGEAAGRIVSQHSQFAEAHQELELIEAYRMRNRLSHGYGSINWLLVWRTACDDVPALASRIRKLLDDT